MVDQAERPFLSLHEAAERLNRSVDDCYRMVRSGELPCMRVGRSIRIPSYAVEGMRTADQLPVMGTPVLESPDSTVELDESSDVPVRHAPRPQPAPAAPTVRQPEMPATVSPARSILNPGSPAPAATAHSTLRAGNSTAPDRQPARVASPPGVRRADDTRIRLGDHPTAKPTVIQAARAPNELLQRVRRFAARINLGHLGSLIYRRETTVLSVSDYKMQALVIKRGKVIAWATVNQKDDIVQDGIVRDVDAFMGSLAALEAKLGGQRLLGRRMALVVSGRNLVLGRFQVDDVRTVPDPASMRDLVCDRLSVKAEDVVADFSSREWHERRRTRADDEGSQPASVFGVAVFRSILESVLRPVSDTGARVIDVQPKAIALAAAVDAGLCVVVELEPGNISVIILRDGLVEVVRDASISSELKPSQIADILAGQVNRSVGYYNARYPEDPLPSDAPIYVAADGVLDRAAVDLALGMLPYRRQALPNPFESEEAFQPAAYAGALGVARMQVSRKSRAACSTSMDFEFLPLEYRPRPFPARAVAGAAITGVLLAGLIPGYIAVRNAGDRADQLRSSTERLESQVRLRAIQARSASTIDTRIAGATKELAHLEASAAFVKGNRRGFSDTLGSIKAALPVGVALQQIDDDGLLVQVRAAAPRPDELFEFIRALSAIDEFSDVRIRTIGLDDLAITADIQILRRGTDPASIAAPPTTPQ